MAAQEAGEAFLGCWMLHHPCAFVPFRKSVLVRRAQEEPAEPVREVAADEQQRALLQRAEELLGTRLPWTITL